MSDTTRSLGEAPADTAEDGVVANSPEATFPGKKSGQKSSHFRGVTLFRPTMKWRAQISAGGKTTSLGDHDTEEEAARAFDRAAINKAGMAAKVNFRIEDYQDEVEQLQALSQTELVAMLRSKARKSGTQTSHYRGVSLLKQTQKWHAQINVGGKQVHLGFFPTEEQAARAYDRAAINKGARDGGKIITNMEIGEYEHELDMLRRIAQDELVSALSSESRRKQTMEMLASGLIGKAEEVFGHGFDAGSSPVGVCAVSEILAKAERAQPKPTQANQLYANFGKKKEYGEGEGPSPPVRLPDLPYTPQRRGPRARRALFQKRPHDFNSSSSSSDEEADEDLDFDKLDGEQPEHPTRRSARNATKTAKKYNEGSDLEVEGGDQEPGTRGSSPEHAPQAKATPQSRIGKDEWASSSPPFRQRKPRGRTWKADGLVGAVSVHADARKGEAGTRVVVPREDPPLDLIAEAVDAARKADEAKKSQQVLYASALPNFSARPEESIPGTSGARAPSELPRIDSLGAATAGSYATATAGDLIGNGVRQEAVDKGSQAVIGTPLADTASIRAGRFVDPPTAAAREPAHNRDASVVNEPKRESVTPVPIAGTHLGENGHSLAAVEGDSHIAGAGGSAAGGSAGEKGSVVVRSTPPRDKGSTLAGVGGPLGDKLSDAGYAVAIAVNGHGPGSVKGASPGVKLEGDVEATHAAANGKRGIPRKGGKRREAPALESAQKRSRPIKTAAAAAEEEGEMEVPASKPMTKRQRAMMERKRGKGSRQAQHSPSSSNDRAEPSPHSSFAANVYLSPGTSAAAAKGELLSKAGPKRPRLQADAASQSSPPVRPDRNTDDEEISSSDESNDGQSGEKRVSRTSDEMDGLVTKREGPHRRTRRKPARAAL